jgi:hypothetical protein
VIATRNAGRGGAARRVEALPGTAGRRGSRAEMRQRSLRCGRRAQASGRGRRRGGAGVGDAESEERPEGAGVA